MNASMFVSASLMGKKVHFFTHAYMSDVSGRGISGQARPKKIRHGAPEWLTGTGKGLACTFAV